MQINKKITNKNGSGTENIFITYQNIKYIRCFDKYGHIWWLHDDSVVTTPNNQKEKELEKIYTKCLRLNKLKRICK